MIFLVIGLVLGFLLGARLISLMILYSAETGKLYRGRYKVVDLTKGN